MDVSLAHCCLKERGEGRKEGRKGGRKEKFHCPLILQDTELVSAVSASALPTFTENILFCPESEIFPLNLSVRLTFYS